MAAKAKPAKAATPIKGKKATTPARGKKAATPVEGKKPATPATKGVRRKPARAPVEVEAPAAAAVEVRRDSVVAEQDPVATAKLALGPEADTREQPATIPWSYGVDRITAAAVDPDRLFVYWEVTDPAIERARTALGPGGAGGWLVLRVYDTSGLIFDGTNARSYFDHPVERATRQWFFDIGKPTSTAFVEIGMKSAEGFFARIVRSGRVDFPRREPAPWSDPEWMTVRPWSGEVADVHRSPAGARGAGAPRQDGRAEPGSEPIPIWTLRDPGAVHEVVLRQLLESGWERVEWSETSGDGWFALEARSEWESPRVLTSWETGPFTYPVEIEPPRREEWEGRGFAYRAGNVTHVVQGPWRVVIRNLGTRSERELIGTWEIHRSWSVEGGRQLSMGSGGATLRVGASESVAAGASERRWISASELRLGGASERWRVGASEVHFRGATEQLFAGASQAQQRGASERQYAGGSESRLGGASEGGYAGGSEGRLAGASELRLDEGGSALPLAYPAPERPDPDEED